MLLTLDLDLRQYLDLDLGKVMALEQAKLLTLFLVVQLRALVLNLGEAMNLDNGQDAPSFASSVQAVTSLFEDPVVAGWKVVLSC